MKSIMKHAPTVGMESIGFEGMNRMPPLKRLTERRAQITPDGLNTWYEYIPEAYDGSVPVPLVVQLHGGGNDGYRWATFTAWHVLAERNNFIVIYPNSPCYGRWMCDEADVKYLYDLIELNCAAYKIDRSRIYMQGMSNGDMMTLAFTLKHPEVLAAAGYITGPSPDEAIDGDMPAGPLPILQMRGELDVNWELTPDTPDVFAARYGMNDLNREIWEPVNGTLNAPPALSIRGKDNFLYYPGENAPIINWEVTGMGHREPSCGAQVLWDRLYSGYRRVNGKIVAGTPNTPTTPDSDVVLIAAGSRFAWCGDHQVAISELDQACTRVFTPQPAQHFCPVKLGEMAETEVMATPVDILASVYGAHVYSSDAGATAVVTLADGRKVTLHSHAMLYDVDGKLCELQKPCILLGGALYIPIGELMQQLYGSHVSIADDVMCISGHYAELGRYTAQLIRRLLGGVMRPRLKPVWDAD